MKNFTKALQHLVIAAAVLVVFAEILHMALMATGMTK